MKQKLYAPSYKVTKSIKNKNLELTVLLQKIFNFSYAGKCEVFIQKRYDKFELVHSGVHLIEDIYTFSPHYVARYKFDTLYQAILGFNKTVQIITSSMDWYDPDLFMGTKIYDEIFMEE